MHILVTNDDGIHAPGLLALAGGLRRFGRVTVLAPERNWSTSGHVKTMHRPLRVHPIQLADGTPALAADGAPSDCVALVLLGLLDEPVDLVVSGINPNANVGHDVTYSGTVTAAMEAAIAGKPGFAVSLDSPDGLAEPPDFGAAAEIAAQLVESLKEHPLPQGLLLNINIPYLPIHEIKGLAITRQGIRVYRDALEKREDPRGRAYYWIGGESPTGIPEPGSDFWALSQGMVSVTPLMMDLTAHDWIPKLESWDLRIE